MMSPSTKQQIAKLRQRIKSMSLTIDRSLSNYVSVIENGRLVAMDDKQADEVVGAFNVLLEESEESALWAIPNAIEYGIHNAYRRDEVWTNLFRAVDVDDERPGVRGMIDGALSVLVNVFWQRAAEFSPSLLVDESMEVHLSRPLSQLVPELILESLQQGASGGGAITTCFHYLANRWLYLPESPEKSANALQCLIRVWSAPKRYDIQWAENYASIYYDGKIWCAATDAELINRHITIAQDLLKRHECGRHIEYLRKVMNEKLFDPIW